jgi:hypothetical protein
MKPSKPLPRRTPLRRTPFKTKATARLKRASTLRMQRYTGPTKKMRDAVLRRDNYTCQKCGRDITGRPYSLQHLLPRGRGGKNTMSNLVTVCGSATTPGGCHDLIENQARRACTDLGWLVPNDVAPEEWAVWRFGDRWELPGETEWVPAKPHALQLAAAA